MYHKPSPTTKPQARSAVERRHHALQHTVGLNEEVFDHDELGTKDLRADEQDEQP